MRKGINGLSVMIADELLLDPGNGSLYIFYNRSYNKLKLIYWDRNGFCLYYKILSREKFKIPKILSVKSINHDEMRWLFDGLDFEKTKGFKPLSYSSYY